MILLGELLLNSEPALEQSILFICEIISTFTQASPDLMKALLNDYILQPLVLNTSHPKSSVRKISRASIANYVRQYKDLKPILRTFTEYGIIQNDNLYSK